MLMSRSTQHRHEPERPGEQEGYRHPRSDDLNEVSNLDFSWGVRLHDTVTTSHGLTLTHPAGQLGHVYLTLVDHRLEDAPL